MTTTSIASVLGVIGVAVLVPVAQAIGDSPWWLAVIVLPLAGFTAWLVRYILDQQKTHDAAIAEREKRREVREDQRVVQAEAQTSAMQSCVVELRALHAAQMATRDAINDIPDRVLHRLDQRKT